MLTSFEKVGYLNLKKLGFMPNLFFVDIVYYPLDYPSKSLNIEEDPNADDEEELESKKEPSRSERFSV